MGAITNLIRRGAVYYWRRRLRWPDQSICAICVSLRTARLEVARCRAERLVLFAEHALSEVATMALQEHLSLKDRQDLFNRSIKAEIWRLSVYRERSAIFEAGPEGGWNESFSLILNNLIAATAVPAERNLPLREGKEAFENYCGYILPRLSLRGQEDFDYQMPSFHDIEYEWLHYTERALREISVEPSTENLQSALRSIYAGKNRAERVFRKALQADQLDHVETDVPCGVGGIADAWAEWPYLLMYETQIAELSDRAEGSVPKFEPEPRVQPAQVKERRSSDYLDLTVSEAAEKFINENSLDGNAQRKADSPKRQKINWNRKTLSQFITAVNKLLGKIHLGKICELTQDTLDELDDVFNRLPTSHHKSELHDALSLDDIIKEGKAAVSAGTKDDKSIGLETPTANRHWNFIKRFLHGIGREDLEFDKYISVDRRNRRDLRAPHSLEMERNIFNIAIWNGCVSEKDRLSFGDVVLHDSFYWGFILGAYSGARLSEIIPMPLGHIVTEGAIPYYHIDGDRAKNASSIRDIPIHSEIIRLNFIQYVEMLKAKGHKFLFPELFGFRTPPSGRFSKLLYPRIRKLVELHPHEVFHSFRHTVDTELKAGGVSVELRADLLGHALSSETAGRYAKAARLSQMCEVVEFIPNVTSHLSSFPIRLLAKIDSEVARAPTFPIDRSGSRRALSVPPMTPGRPMLE